MTEKLTQGASGAGVATLAASGVLDVYFPEPRLGADREPGTRETGPPTPTTPTCACICSRTA